MPAVEMSGAGVAGGSAAAARAVPSASQQGRTLLRTRPRDDAPAPPCLPCGGSNSGNIMQPHGSLEVAARASAVMPAMCGRAGFALHQLEQQEAADHAGGQSAGDQRQAAFDEVAHRRAEEARSSAATRKKRVPRVTRLAAMNTQKLKCAAPDAMVTILYGIGVRPLIRITHRPQRAYSAWNARKAVAIAIQADQRLRELVEHGIADEVAQRAADHAGDGADRGVSARPRAGVPAPSESAAHPAGSGSSSPPRRRRQRATRARAARQPAPGCGRTGYEACGLLAGARQSGHAWNAGRIVGVHLACSPDCPLALAPKDRRYAPTCCLDRSCCCSALTAPLHGTAPGGPATCLAVRFLGRRHVPAAGDAERAGMPGAADGDLHA